MQPRLVTGRIRACWLGGWLACARSTHSEDSPSFDHDRNVSDDHLDRDDPQHAGAVSPPSAANDASERREFFTVCDHDSCSGASSDWSYEPTSDRSRCTGPGAASYAMHAAENIDLDAPRAGDHLRIAVRCRNNGRGADDVAAGIGRVLATRSPIHVHRRGELRAAFGGDPEQTEDREDLRLSESGQLWRVADVLVTQSRCDVRPLRDANARSHDWLVKDDSGYGAP